MLTPKNSTKWVNNTLIFIRPVLLLYLGYVSTNIGDHGFNLSDFIPSSFILGGMVLYVVNVFTDYLRKLELQKELEFIDPAIIAEDEMDEVEKPEPISSTPVAIEEPIA